MRTILPAYLIHSILLLSAAAIEPSRQCGRSGSPSRSTAEAATKTPLTLWDLGFSLKDKWMDLREEEACPAPPDLICIDGGAECGDQQVMEQVAAHIRPGETHNEPVERPAEPVQVEEDLVSFEDWKRRKLGEEEDTIVHYDDLESSTTTYNAGSSVESSISTPVSTEAVRQANKTNGDNRTVEDKNNSSSSLKQKGEKAEPPKVPAHNKYNYASPDCSARIHSSSRLTQHASSLLHKSRDRYMLTPCKAHEHWVVVELCDEIRVEAIEIAVWEFFSGVVREVEVSVGGANDDEDDDDGQEARLTDTKWEKVGTFVGKNIRGVQTFTLPQPTSFQRFLRLDFPSYFGTEYYCPVSQLKVYGMNQMEAFKSEQKRLAATAKDRDKEKVNKDKEAEERRQREKNETEVRLREQVRQENKQRERELDELERLVLQQARPSVVPDLLTSLPKDLDSINIVTETTPVASSATSVATTVYSVASTTNHSRLDASRESELESEQNTTRSSSSAQTTKAATRSDSSESIYAHIIRRLNALEGNSSLVARYIEEQAKVMRHMLTRVEKGWDEWRIDREMEELSRWDQERMRQEDRLGKVISQMEQQRQAMDAERREVLSEIRVLSAELGYERRRGIAQLLITLVIIALGVASRSSTIDAVLKPLVAEARRRRSMKSISGPLSGLEIDMGSGRPPAVVGQPPAQKIAGMPDPSMSRHQRTSSMKRPVTPRRRHHTGPTSSYMRIFSDSTPHLGGILTTPPTQPVMGSPFAFEIDSDSKISKPRVSLPPARIVGGARKLARSAHLHPMEADRVRNGLSSPTAGESTPRGTPRRALDSVLSPNDRIISPLTTDDAVFPDALELGDDLDIRSDWGTDAGESASEVENEIQDRAANGNVLKDLDKVWTDEPQVLQNKLER